MFKAKIPGFLAREANNFCRAHSLGRRGDGSDGTFTHQLVGTICENAVRFAFGQPMLSYTGESDGGADIVIAGHRVDIKSTRIDRDVREYHTHAVPESQIHFDTEIYLFCALDTTRMVMTVTGYLPKEEFMWLAKRNAKGDVSVTPNGKTFVNRHTTYEVKVGDLISDFANFDELQDKMVFA
jgi:hypothetical protein